MWINNFFLSLFIFPIPPAEIYSQIVPDGIAQALAAMFHRLMDFAWAVSAPRRVRAMLLPLTKAQLKEFYFKIEYCLQQN